MYVCVVCVCVWGGGGGVENRYIDSVANNVFKRVLDGNRSSRNHNVHVFPLYTITQLSIDSHVMIRMLANNVYIHNKWAGMHNMSFFRFDKLVFPAITNQTNVAQ